MTLSFFKDKKILITGHTGFKGAWLSLLLLSVNANVLGYSLAPEKKEDLFNVLNLADKMNSVIGNILDVELLEKTFFNFKPEIVIHLAAQPLVRQSYLEPVLTYQTNVMGTLNVLEVARKSKSVLAFVNVTTDKCYKNKEISYAYKESDALGGYDMYSSSKACSEILSSSYRNSFLQESYSLATARAGNVIGGGDWAKDRLVPDCIKSIYNNNEILIRNPKAIRPWQFVLEPLLGYLKLAKFLYLNGEKFSQAYNFGPNKEDILKVEELVKKIIFYYGKGDFNVELNDNLHEAQLLMLNNEKAQKELNWSPVYNVEKAIQETVSWYKAFNENLDMYDFSLMQINKFIQMLIL